MTSYLDKYSKINSIIHYWDARFKFVSLFILVFSFSFIMNIYLILPMFIIAVSLYIFSRLPFIFLLKRLSVPSIFIVIMVIVLPFLSGKTSLFSFGIINIRKEGLILSITILSKFLSIFIIIIIIFGTQRFNKLIEALRVLKIPIILTDIILFSYRYIFTFGEMLQKMKNALRMKGFFLGNNSYKKYFERVKNFSSVIGSIFVRSYEKSERISHAMILRGYGNKISGNVKIFHDFKTRTLDIILCIIILFFSVSFIFLELFLSNYFNNIFCFF